MGRMGIKEFVVLFLLLLMAFIVFSGVAAGGNVWNGILGSSWMGDGAPYRWLQSPIEGFNGLNPLESETLAGYNSGNTVHAIYSNFWYDSRTGNVIEKVMDLSGNWTNIRILPRNPSGSSIDYPVYDASGNMIVRTTSESLGSSVSISKTGWSYRPAGGNTQLIYIGLDQDTYIHILDLTRDSPQMLYSVYFQTNASVKGFYSWPASAGVPTKTTSFTPSKSAQDGTNSVVEPYYDKNAQLTQISTYVRYDVTNGNLILTTRETPKEITVYSRSGGTPVKYTSSSNATTSSDGHTESSKKSTLSIVDTTPFLINDDLGTQFIIYWPVYNRTVITTFRTTIDKKTGMDFEKLLTLIGSTVYTGSSGANYESGTLPGLTTTTTTTTTSESETEADLKAKWYTYWILNGVGDPDFSGNDFMNRYIDKTQVVPPVCPSCPHMGYEEAVREHDHHNSHSHGGHGGGHGTLLGGVGEAVEETAEGVRDGAKFVGTSVRDGVDFTGSSVRDGVKFVGTSAKEGVQFLGSSAKEGVGEVWSTLKGIGGERHVGAGGGGPGGPHPPPPMGGHGQNREYVDVNRGYIGGTQDPYARNGQIPPSASFTSGSQVEPMPVTADFSAFGR